MNSLLVKYLSILNNIQLGKRILLFIGIAAILFMTWNTFLWNKLKILSSEINNQIINISKENELLKQAIIKKKQQAEEKKLNLSEREETELGQQIQNLENYAIDQNDKQKVLSDIISSETGLYLLSEIHNLPEKIITNPNDSTILYEQSLIIRFKGDYFSTLVFIKRLEQLKWPLFLDRLEYNVTKYPIANVIIQLHIISKQEGFINV